MKLLENNRGIALLITLSVITLMLAFALELNHNVRSSLMSVASGHRDRLTLSYMAAGGIQVTMGLLAQHKTEPPETAIRDDLEISESLNEALESIPFENGKLSINVIDEMSKIQINAMVKYPEGKETNDPLLSVLQNFLAPRIPKDMKKKTELETIVNRIIDWLDTGDGSRNPGESKPSHYRSGPFVELGELTQIKGITPELIESMGGFAELSKYVTVYGMTTQKTGGFTQSPNTTASKKQKNFTFDGKININTAELPILAALLGGNLEVANAIYQYREEMKSDQYVPNWFVSDMIPDCPECRPALNALLQRNIITSSSDFFRIEANATLNDVKLKATAVVHREQDKKTGKWICKVLSWQTE